MTCETNGLEFAYKYLSIIGPQFGFLDHQDVEFMAEPRDIWARILRHRCGWKKGMLSINGRWTGIAILKPTLTSFNELYPPSTFPIRRQKRMRTQASSVLSVIAASQIAERSVDKAAKVAPRTQLEHLEKRGRGAGWWWVIRPSEWPRIRIKVHTPCHQLN